MKNFQKRDSYVSKGHLFHIEANNKQDEPLEAVQNELANQEVWN